MKSQRSAIIIFLLLIISSCQYQDISLTKGNPIPSSAPNVYVGGFESNGTYNVAKYWKNGAPVTLGDKTSNSSVSNLIVSGGDVYCSGVESCALTLWRNGTTTSVDKGTCTPLYAYSNNQNFYMAGIDENSQVVYWKDWVKNTYYDFSWYFSLGGGPYSYSNTGFTVSDDGVIISGNYTLYGSTWGSIEKRIAGYWSSTGFVPLSDRETSDQITTGVTFYDHTLYTAGVDYTGNTSVAKFWKNSTSYPLSDGSKNEITTSISVVGGDVYVTGYEYKTPLITVAKYWINGQEVLLSDGIHNAVANAIFISGDDVYVAGAEHGIAKYWKNGVPISLTDGSKMAMATSIVVK